jgi:hypothetical protein
VLRSGEDEDDINRRVIIDESLRSGMGSWNGLIWLGRDGW